jgi:hypothetical protein
VFLRYLHRERIVDRDLSLVVQAAPCYRLAHVPRSITAGGRTERDASRRSHPCLGPIRT